MDTQAVPPASTTAVYTSRQRGCFKLQPHTHAHLNEHMLQHTPAQESLLASQSPVTFRSGQHHSHTGSSTAVPTDSHSHRQQAHYIVQQSTVCLSPAATPTLMQPHRAAPASAHTHDATAAAALHHSPSLTRLAVRTHSCLYVLGRSHIHTRTCLLACSLTAHTPILTLECVFPKGRAIPLLWDAADTDCDDTFKGLHSCIVIRLQIRTGSTRKLDATEAPQCGLCCKAHVRVKQML